MTIPSPSPELNFQEGEILLIDKPLNWTSFDVVGKIRNTLKPLKLKVGHAGTLDPLATGLLVICTGKLTKKIDEYQAQEKEYTGACILGATTPSYDLETEINQTYNTGALTEEQIKNNCQLFIGTLQQYPPAHSAIKINGERVYEKARRGEDVELKPRTIQISEFEITRVNLPEVHFRVVCSKGTYIRSLMHDFGRSLNNGAYLSSLCRTRIGYFHLNKAWQLPELIQHIKLLKQSEQLV